MKIYNSLNRTLEEFTPINNTAVTMYSCGPTVYNNLHIGNLMAFIYADMVRRTLSSAGYRVKHVMNTTDVDDKTIRDSKRDYPDMDPALALKKLTDKYTEVFLKDLEATGNDINALTFISAVDTIPEMILLTQKIIDSGVGYVADDAVYFSIESYINLGHTYGILQKIAPSSSKARIAHDEYSKDTANDFALWKRGEPGEPTWDSVFTINGTQISMPGRPGWHIECSAMSEKLLGVPFDIHTGGIDLKFPHHENEIAQSCAAGTKTLANYFMHNNHILVNGKKMSKSLGNFYTLRDIEQKGFSPIVFRLVALQSHYRTESNFSWDILEGAQSRLQSWKAHADLVWQKEEYSGDNIANELEKALQNDVDTPKALSIIDTYFEKLNESDLAPSRSFLSEVENLLGIPLLSEDITEEQKVLLAERQKARREKNWVSSDEIRAKLLGLRIGVNDLQDRQIWYRII